jgi:hypothetical protein
VSDRPVASKKTAAAGIPRHHFGSELRRSCHDQTVTGCYAEVAIQAARIAAKERGVLESGYRVREIGTGIFFV